MAIGSRREWHNIDLICRAGLDIATLTPLLCRHIRNFVGAAAAAMFWMDENGMPIGLHHEDSPDSVRNLFVNEFERLFTGPSEINVAMLARSGSGKKSILLSPPPDYFRSNTFNLLIRPSGHHHALDLRVRVDSKVRVIVLLFREEANAFAAVDAERLKMVEPCLLNAVIASEDSGWRTKGEKGQLIVDTGGEAVLFHNDAAVNLLKECTLVGQGINLTGAILRAPGFVRGLCSRPAESWPRQASVFIPSGRLTATATPMHASADVAFPAWAVLVTLEQQVAVCLDVIMNLMQTTLSPIQRKISLAASGGSRRGDIPMQMGISGEALKKHLAAIYSTFNVNSWEALRQTIQAECN